MLRFYRNKFFILMVAFAVVIFFGRMVETTPLTSRGIAVGIAIDKCEEGYDVAVQVLNPIGEQQGQTGYLIMQGKGGTIPDALDDISNHTGKYISLAHCSTIIIGKELIMEQKVNYVSGLVFAAHVPEQANVFVSKGSAGKMLKKHVAQSKLTGAELHAVMLAEEDKQKVQHFTIKDIEYKYLNYKGAVVLPMLEMIEIPKDELDPNLGDGKFYKFNFDNIYIFDRDSDNQVIVSKEEVAFYRIIYGYGSQAIFNLDMDEKTKVSIQIKRVNPTENFTVSKDGHYDFDAQFELMITPIEFVEKNEYFSDKEQKDITRQHLDQISEYFINGIQNLFDKCKEQDIDVYHLYDTFYQYYPKLVCSKKTFLPKVRIFTTIDFEFI